MAEGTATPSSPTSPARVEEISAAVAEALATQFSAIREKLDEVQSSVEAYGKRLQEVEDRVGQVEDTTNTLQQTVESLRNQLRSQEAKIDDLENRSRRNNLRVMGIPESVLASDLPKYLVELFSPLLRAGGDVEGEKIHIERAHRVGSKPLTDSRPRVVLVKLLHFPQKETVLRTARAQGGLVVENLRIRVAQDYSLQLSQRCRAYAPLCQKLIERQIKFTVQYPARLHIFVEGRRKIFDSAEDATPYVESLVSAGGES